MKTLWEMVMRSPDAEGAEGVAVNATDASAEPEVEDSGTEAEGVAAAEAVQTVPVSVMRQRIMQTNRQKAVLEQALQEERTKADNLARELSEYQLNSPVERENNKDRRYTQAEAEALAAEISRKDFLNARSNKVAEAGFKEFGEKVFKEGIELLRDAVGGFPPEFIEAVLEIDEEAAPKVFMALTKDLEETQRLLTLPSHKQAVALTKLVSKVKTPAKVKVQSTAPEPITPQLGGGKSRSTPNLEDETLPMDKWVALRRAQTAKRPVW